MQMMREVGANSVASKSPRARAVRQLKQWVEDGVLAHGDPLPSEIALSLQLQVSRGTLRAALEMLTAEGLIRLASPRTRVINAPHSNGHALRQADSPRSASHSSDSNVATAQPEALMPAINQEPVRIGIIGYWTERVQDYIWNNIAVRAMEKAAPSHGDVTISYFNLYPKSGEAPHTVKEGVEKLMQQGVTCFATLFYTPPAEIEALSSIFDLATTPLVCLQDEGQLPMPLHQISYDVEYSGYQAAQHLLQRGWRSLVFFAPFEASWVWQRLRGAQSAIRTQGLAPDDVLTVWPTQGRTSVEVASKSYERMGHEGGREILRQMSHPRGIIAPNDIVAHGILKAARELKLQPGHDFALVGFDDLSESRLCGLTSLRPPIELMATEAMRMLLSPLPMEQTALYTSFRSELVARASTEFFANAVPSASLRFSRQPLEVNVGSDGFSNVVTVASEESNLVASY
jgi:DNA-binding LacI/PurR family transcriptional regulator/DNA-binding transcriptional regulator YhcF (GntR family)